ncbi:NAD(P)H-binding protein [Amycolatopsis sp. NBC_00355]|uniref:NAD(P)H-binding protein n=1 Tax=Amycolatopsis sp. NBC_00355 TaxID=2975957 RepID=UPI003FA44F77
MGGRPCGRVRGATTKLTLFAASGRTGAHVLDQALSAGHEVTAVARNPDAVTAPIQIVRVDLAAPDPLALKSAVDGCDAVIFALGRRHPASTASRQAILAPSWRRWWRPGCRGWSS